MHEKIQSLYLPFISKSCLGRCWLENISAITHAESDISCMVASWVNSIELLHSHFEHGLKYVANKSIFGNDLIDSVIIN